MKIQNDGIGGSSALQAGRTEELSRAASQREGGVFSEAGLGGDRVEISALTESVSQASAALSARQAERVQHLAALYKNGELHVDSQALSQSLVSNALRGAHGGE